MANIFDIIMRAQALREETALDSISPERAGGIMYDTLIYINAMQLQESNPLVISKIYTTVAAMQADSAPVSDLTGRLLKAGQVVCIVTTDTTSSDYGMIYRYNGTTGGTSSWTAVGKIGSGPFTAQREGTSDIVQLYDGQDPIFPRTKAEAVFFDGDTSKTLDKEFGQLDRELISEIGDITIAGTLVAGTTANFIQGVDLKSGDKIYVTTTLGSGLSVSGMSLKDDAGNILTVDLKTANNMEITLARDTTKLIVYAYGGHISAGGNVSVNIRTGVTHRIDAVLTTLAATVSGLATKNALMQESTMHLALNDGYYIDANGAIQSGASFGYYTIPVCEGATVRAFIALNSGDTVACAAYYDKDGNVVRYSTQYIALPLGGFANTEHSFPPAPAGAVSFKITYRVASKLSLYAHVNFSGAIDSLRESVATTLSGLLEEHNPTNYSSLSFYSHTQASTGLSEEITNTQIKITRTGTKGNDQIKVSMSGLTPGKEYRFRCDAAAFANSQSYVHIVDGNTQATLANCPIVDGKINVTFTPNSTVPQIWIYLRYAEAYVVTFSNILISEPDANVELLIKESLLKYLDGSIFANDFASANNIFDGADPTTYGGEEMRVFKKGICIGDSLVKGTFNYNVAQGTEYAVVDVTRSYPQFLAKMLGITIDNVATGGVTTAGWWAEYGNGDYSGNDFVIIHLGINDIIKNGSWNEDSATALTNIINKFKSDNNGIKIFVCTGFPFTAYLNAGVALATALATFVEGLADANVILIDTFRYCHIDENVAYNNVHGTALGYWKLATELKNYISWYIHNHLSEFRAVQFIGTNYVL